MSKNTQITLTQSIQECSMESENDMDFTLKEHHSERIAHHSKMLRYYLNEERVHGKK